MIKEALKDITLISDDETDNTENYLDALNYLDNIYKLIIVLQEDIELNELKFLPSFKGKYICERLGIASTAYENELKDFRIKSSLFLDDKNLVKRIKKHCEEVCSMVSFSGDTMIFILK